MRAAVLSRGAVSLALMLIMGLPALSTHAHADYITFNSGEVVWVESWELRDDHYVFTMYGGTVSVPRHRVLKIERQSSEEFGSSKTKLKQTKLESELQEKLRALERAEDELASRPNPDLATTKQERLERLREEIRQLKERLGE